MESESLAQIVVWLQDEHNTELTQLDHQKRRGDQLAYTLLKKMLFVGMISEYTLRFEESNGRWQSPRTPYWMRFDLAHPTGYRVPQPDT
jgi:hypothetical protein